MALNSDGNPLTRASNARRMKNRDSRTISRHILETIQYTAVVILSSIARNKDHDLRHQSETLGIVDSERIGLT